MISAPGRTSASGAVEENRRLYPRRRLTFPATFSIDRRSTLPAFGLDLSGGGIRLFTREPIATPSNHGLTLVALVEGRKLQVRVHRRWSNAFDAPAGVRYRHGLQLAKIADRDWEFLMRLTLEGNEFVHGIVSAAQLGLPIDREKQQRIWAALEKAGRLSHAQGSRPPPLEYALEGYAMRRGVPYYHVRVRTKGKGGSGGQEQHLLVAIERDVVKLLD
jgi:hypothetical protein